MHLFMINDGSVTLRGLQSAAGSPALVCSPSLATSLQLAPGAVLACQTAHTISSQDQLETGIGTLQLQLHSLNVPSNSTAPFTKAIEVPVVLHGSSSLQVNVVTGACGGAARARE
jgi:hypothetical protein